jgi:hypothetical protein
MPLQEKIEIPKSLLQTYTLVSEEKRIPFLISYLHLLNGKKIIMFVATIDEVEFFEFMLNNIKYRDY